MSFWLILGWPVSVVHRHAKHPLWYCRWLPARHRLVADFASSIEWCRRPNLAIGLQLATAEPWPSVIRERRAFRAAHVDGLGTFTVEGRTLVLHPFRQSPAQQFHLSWTRRVVHLAA